MELKDKLKWDLLKTFTKDAVRLTKTYLKVCCGATVQRAYIGGLKLRNEIVTEVA